MANPRSNQSRYPAPNHGTPSNCRCGKHQNGSVLSNPFSNPIHQNRPSENPYRPPPRLEWDSLLCAQPYRSVSPAHGYRLGQTPDSSHDQKSGFPTDEKTHAFDPKPLEIRGKRSSRPPRFSPNAEPRLKKSQVDRPARPCPDGRSDKLGFRSHSFGFSDDPPDRHKDHPSCRRP